MSLGLAPRTLQPFDVPDIVIEPEAFDAFVEALRLSHGLDLSPYKPSSVLRRIVQRIRYTQSPSLAAYQGRLMEDQEERRRFIDSLWINFTQFFRDREPFRLLATHVVPDLLADPYAPQHPLRMWSIGCSTGEEPYSLAMVVLERAENPRARSALIYATDLDEGAVAAARRGRYIREQMTGVPPEFQRRYFEIAENGEGQVRGPVRDIVRFGLHNILVSSPISHLDLICFRNLLIYFRRDVQERLFEQLRFALNPGGYLLLGKAETLPGVMKPYFHEVSKSWRLYRRGWDRKTDVPRRELSALTGDRHDVESAQ